MRIEGQREREDGATPGTAGDGKLAVHELDEPANDREAKSCAAMLPRRRCIALDEGLEQLLDDVGLHADAGVANLETEQRAPGAQRYRENFQRNFAGCA